MAVRLNTIKYPIGFGAVSDAATLTTTYVGITSMYIAENVGIGITFASALLYITWQDTSTVTGGTISEYQTHVTLSGATTNIYKELNDLSNTGENSGGIIGPIDYTNYFNTNFGISTIKGCSLSVFFQISTGTGQASRGIYGWFDLTYAYDDTAADRTKTISIPYESLTGTLPTNASTKFAALMPLETILDGYPDLQIRNNFAHLYGNVNANNSATDITVSYNVTPGITTVALPTRECALASDSFQLYQLDFSNTTLGVANTIYIYTSTTARFMNVILDQFVTFTHSGVGVTQILNYIELPFKALNSPPQFTLNAYIERIVKNVIIPETNVISRAIAINFTYTAQTSTTIGVSAGAQSAAALYAMSATQVSGQFAVQHLGDTRSRNGVGTTIVSGYNSFIFNLSRSVNFWMGLSGKIKLLYNSSPPTDIDDSSKTISFLHRVIGFANTSDYIVFQSPVGVLGTNLSVNGFYYIHSFGAIQHVWAAANTSGYIEYMCTTNSSEVNGLAWNVFNSIAQVGDAEISYVSHVVPYGDYFSAFPGETNNKLGIQSTRYWRMFTIALTNRYGGVFQVCYHNIKTPITGSITGSSGGTINIKAYDFKTKTGIASTTIVGNGGYSLIVYSPNIPYYVVASESNTLNGVSTIGLPGAGFNIALVSTMPINAGYYG